MAGYNRQANKKRISLEDIMRISDALLPELDQELANTRKCLERIPDNKFSYKPHPKSMDMGTLAVHIATVCDWGVIILKQDDFDYAPPGAPFSTERAGV